MSWQIVVSMSFRNATNRSYCYDINVITEGENMRRETGATTTEYALLVTFIAVAVVTGILLFRGAVSDSLGGAAECVEGVAGGGVEDCPGGGAPESNP